jgi:hypothetical protein
VRLPLETLVLFLIMCLVLTTIKHLYHLTTGQVNSLWHVKAHVKLKYIVDGWLLHTKQERTSSKIKLNTTASIEMSEQYSLDQNSCGRMRCLVTLPSAVCKRVQYRTVHFRQHKAMAKSVILFTICTLFFFFFGK